MGVGEMSATRASTCSCIRPASCAGARPRDVEPAGSGIRAQALAPDGTLVDDFVLERRPGVVHVRNAPSPGATSSIAIGATIADMAEEAFGLTG